MQPNFSQSRAFEQIEGAVEWQITGHRRDGTRIISHLIGEEPARAMSVGARDQLLCQLYGALYGNSIEATRQCGNCDEPYDFDFRIADIASSLTEKPQPENVHRKLDDERAELKSGHILRAPTAIDEEAVSAMTVEAAEAALVSRCVDDTNAHSALDPATVAKVMEWLSPIIDLDLTATCPECGFEESLRFSMEHYLVRSLLAERRQLTREMHLLASTYHWGLDQILQLNRQDRRHLAALVEAERFAARGGVL